MRATRRFVRRQRSWFRRDAAHHLVRRRPRRPGSTPSRSVITDRTIERVSDRAAPRVLLGHGTENDFVVLPDPDGDVWPETRLDAAWSAGCATAAPVSAATACCASSAPCTSPMRRGARRALALRMVHGPPQRRRRRTRRCAATASGCSCTSCVTEGLLDRAAARPASWSAPAAGRAGSGRTPDGDLLGRHGPGPAVRRGQAQVAGATFSGLAVSMGNPHLACLTDVDDRRPGPRPRRPVRPGALPRRRQRRADHVLEPARTSGSGCRARRGGDPVRDRGVRGGLRGAAATGTEGTVVVDVPGGACRCRSTGTTVLTGPP